MKKVYFIIVIFLSVTGITNVSAQINIVVTQIDSVSCFGGSNGSITDTVNGGVTPYTYLWNTIPPQTTATAINLPSGTYTVTVTDADSNSATASATVCQPAQLIVQLDSLNEECINDCNGQANSIVTGGALPYHFHWINGYTTQTITNLCPGIYCLTVIDANGCTASDVTHVGTMYRGDAGFTTTPTAGYAPLNVYFTYTGYSFSFATYNWSFGDGGISSTENPSHQFTQTGSFNVVLLAAHGSCLDTCKIVITVLDSNLFVVYPIPAKGSITIETIPQSTIEIYNILGQIIKTIIASDFKTYIDISGFAKGMYFLRVKTENGWAVRKFVKE